MKLNLENYEMELDKKIKVRGEFINRELSLIDFDERVLYYAMSKKIPLNERMNFLAITGSNLDEFLSVRFPISYEMKESEPYKKILKRVKKFKRAQDSVFVELKSEFEKKGAKFTKVSDLNKKEKKYIYEVYMNNIFPLLAPMNLNGINEIPCISSGEVCIVATIIHAGVEDVVIVPIIKEIDPIYQIDNKVILVEDIIKTFMNESLFINKEIVSYGMFRIIKDANITVSHDTNKFIVDRMRETLYERDHSKPIFLDVSKNTPERLIPILCNLFKIPSGHVYDESKVLGYHRFTQKLLSDKESYEPFSPFNYENHENYFDAIDNEDILLHHPFDSYDTVVKFIEHAAVDKKVVAIKQTLYRVSGIDSPIVNALCKAAENGKKVTVLIEIKARFDEYNNIRLINKLENAGATVLLGLEYLKTHCKLCVVIRKEKGDLKLYSHVATGNYNEKTARLYTDISYFTSKKKIGMDLLHIFNILSGNSQPDEKLNKIFYAPVNLRKNLIKCIDREIAFAKKGRKAEIFIKVNSMSDPVMADKIYEAADKGVSVYLIVRGVCSIVPRKNLYIKSIVGRFLEHNRIYYFRNGGSPEYYISSADLLTRNLDKRVETLISLKDSKVVKQLEWMIKVYKEDQKNSFIMDGNGKWKHASGNFSCHEWFIKHSDIKKERKKWKK